MTTNTLPVEGFGSVGFPTNHTPSKRHFCVARCQLGLTDYTFGHVKDGGPNRRIKFYPVEGDICNLEARVAVLSPDNKNQLPFAKIPMDHIFVLRSQNIKPEPLAVLELEERLRILTWTTPIVECLPPQGPDEYETIQSITLDLTVPSGKKQTPQTSNC